MLLKADNVLLKEPFKSFSKFGKNFEKAIENHFKILQKKNCTIYRCFKS